ncbi:MAG: hypothetical protein LLG05_18960 [Porphyromonadaceae bacterium]|nr:hypothetical protein [Porphyromonadaceae bacterium]
MIYTKKNKLPVEILDGDLKAMRVAWKFENGNTMGGSIEKLEADGGIDEIIKAVTIAFLTKREKLEYTN